MKTNTSEFIHNPSPASQELCDRVQVLEKKYEQLFSTDTVLGKLKLSYRIQLYIKNGYRDFYQRLNSFYIPKKTDTTLTMLLDLFSELYDRILYNNSIMTYLYIQKNDTHSSIETIEDKRIRLMQQCAREHLSHEKFLQKFGHYSLNEYELSAPRFHELSSDSLNMLFGLALTLQLHNKASLDEAMLQSKRGSFAILHALRELGKDKVVRLIDALRQELLTIEQEQQVNSIFSQTFSDILKLENKQHTSHHEKK